jgi:hypothetical protein
MKINMRVVRNVCRLELYSLLVFIFCFYEINKPIFIYNESKDLPKKQKIVNKNMKIKHVCTMGVQNLVTA